MRKLIFAAIMMTMAGMQAQAQTNPKRGYVITNERDTIHGTIDYLSDTRNANECRFKADGADEYTTYRPQDISGYRFADDGIYYVTRTLPVEGEQRTFFAEYLLQGGVSLFHHKEQGYDYYYLVSEDGRVATVKDDIPWLLFNKKSKESKRAALREASQLLCLSQKAQDDMWKHNINAETLTQITRDYDMEFCTDAGECVQFRYDKMTARSVVAKLRLQLAVGQLSASVSPNERALDRDHNAKLTQTMAKMGIGADFLFPRASSHWTAQAMALLSYCRQSKDMVDSHFDHGITNNGMKYVDFGLQLGAAYSFMPQRCVSPVVRGGLAVDVPIGSSVQGLTAYHVSANRGHIEMGAGFYVGVGADIRMGKHTMRINAEYQRTYHNVSSMKNDYLNINVGIRI